MALSGSTKVQVTAYNDLVFFWEASQDAVQGLSNINWQLQLVAGTYGRIDATPGSRWAVTVDGQEFSGTTSIAVSNNATKILASGTVALSHNDDGTRNFDYTFFQEFYITFSDVYIESASGSGSGVLDPISMEAAPLLSVDAAYLGDTIQITPQGSAGATYKLEYQMGAESGTIGEDLSVAAVEWTLPESLGNQMPYTEQGTVRIICTAYIDGVRSGKPREAALIAMIPESAVPTVSGITWEDTSKAAALRMLFQNVSKLTVEGDCAGAMGSRIESCAILIGGKPYNGGVLETSGEVQLTVTVTDTRGRTGSGSVTLNVTAYHPPSVQITAHRCLEDGTASDTGGFAQIYAVVKISEFEGNTATGLFTAGTFQEESTIETQTELQWLLEVSTEATLMLRMEVTDLLSTGYDSMVLSTAHATLDLLYGGKGIAFGATATEPGFLCAMDATFTGQVKLPDGSLLLDRLKALEEAVAALSGTQ